MTTSTLLIQCLLLREGGSKITMKDGAIYHFADDGLGNHVASVSNPDHIQCFMQIPEAYRIFSPDAVAKLDQPKIAPVGAGIMVSDAAMAPSAPAPTDAAPAKSGVELSDLSDAELRDVFRAEVGRNPSHKAGTETMIAQIEAIRAERTA